MNISTLARRRPRTRQLFGMLAVVVLLGAWWTWFRPPVLGGSATVITVSGRSMEPGMHTGDMVLVRDTNDYRIGDVVAYQPRLENGKRGGMVIHRIVGIESDGFVLKGDNNDFLDPWHVPVDEIAGERIVHVKNIGAYVAKLREPAPLAASVTALTVFLILTDGKRLRKKQNTSEVAQDAPASSGETS
ncbi:MAG: signal peptidase I [Sporichthyaceae bacterium]